MEQITIIKPNATEIDLMRLSPAISNLEAIQSRTLLDVDIVTISFISPEVLDIDIKDKVVIFNEEYTLNELPAIQKTSTRAFAYMCIFEGSMYDLLKVQFLNADVFGGAIGTSFDLTGELKDFIDVIINNMNRVYPGKWSLISYPETDVKTMNFSEANCLEALQNICSEFQFEFEITQGASGLRYLAIKKLGNVLAYQYEYGVGNGLYEITRQKVDKRNLITRLYAYGSEKNLQSNYRNYSARLKFNDNGYIENTPAIATFGLIEGTKIFDDVYPHRKGTITGISTNKRAFFDSTMFDLNETDVNGTKWLIAGTTAKIQVLTGNLAGYEFELENYTHGTKQFIVKEYKDNRGETFPSATISVFQFEVGDVYTITDIKLPTLYIANAESELLEKAQAFLDENSQPTVNYQIEVDEMYLAGTQNPSTAQSNLPTGWIYTDINTTLAGFAQFVQNLIMVSEGANLGGTTDSLGFLHRSSAGLGSSLNSLLTLESKYFQTNNPIDTTVKYGLMARFGLANNSKFAALKIENGQLILVYRLTVGGAVQTLGTNQAFVPSTKYGIQIVDTVVKITKLLSNKFTTTINEIDLSLTPTEITDGRIGYFITNTNLERAVLKIDSYGNSTNTNPIPTNPGSTVLGAYNYININNGNLGAATYENSNYILRNAGPDVWDLLNSNLDSFGYLFLNIADSTAKIKAHLVQEPKYLGTNIDLDQFTRAGIMWRASNSNNSDYIAIAQNITGVILFYERFGGQSNVTMIIPLITNKTTIKDFYLKVVAAAPGVSTRLMTVTAGYIENGEEVPIGSVSHSIANATYADSKLGIFQISKSLTERAVLNASILVDEVVNTNNPCGKPGDMGSDICMVQWGEIV